MNGFFTIGVRERVKLAPLIRGSESFITSPSQNTGLSVADVYEIFNSINPLPINFFAGEDIVEYQIVGSNLRQATVFADGRALASISVSSDTVRFNETIYTGQQVLIIYQINL